MHSALSLDNDLSCYELCWLMRPFAKMFDLVALKGRKRSGLGIGCPRQVGQNGKFKYVGI